MSELTEKQGSSQIKKGVVLSYVTLAVYVISSLLYTPWMLGQIGRSHYGLYTLAISIITLFTFDFGMSAAVTRFVSKYNAEKNREGVNNFLGIIYKLYLLISALISIVLIVLYFFLDGIYANLTPAELESFKVVYIIVSISTVTNFPFITLNGILIAYEKFAALRTADIVNHVSTVVLTVIALLSGMGLYALVTVKAICNIITIIIKLYVVRTRTLARPAFRYKDKQLLRNIFGYSAWITVSALAARLVFSITPSVMAVVSGSASIAVFGLARNLERYAYSFANAVNGMFLPKVSRIVTSQDSSGRLLQLMIKVGRISFSVVALVLMGFALFGREFILLWVGIEYIDVYYCALLIISPGIIYMTQHIAEDAMKALGEVRIISFTNIAMCIISITLSAILSGPFGAVGASAAICVALLTAYILLTVIYHQKLKISMFTFFSQCHLKMLPAAGVSFVIGYFLNRYLNFGGGFMNLGIKIVCFIIVYAVVMWLIGWNEYEKNLLKSMIPRRKLYKGG